MSQGPNQPPQPQWDPQRQQWYIPSNQQPAGPPGGEPSSAGAGYGRHGAPGGGGHGAPDASPSDGRSSGVYSGPYQAAYVPQPPQPARKTRKWPWILGGFVVVIILAVSCGGGSETASTTSASGPSSSALPAAPAASSAPASSASASGGVVYEVTGSGRANNITYGGLSKGLSQANGQRLPWRKTAPSTEGFESYGLTAQNGGSGEITCRITVDGEEIASNTSSGQYAVVSCNGTSSPF